MKLTAPKLWSLPLTSESIRQILCLLLFSVFPVMQAQQVKVIDGFSGNPVVGALVSDPDALRQTETDQHGEFDLQPFKDFRYLQISNPGYRALRLRLSDVHRQNYVLLMEGMPELLGEVVLSVNRMPQQAVTLVQKVEQVTAEEIALSNSPTAADLLSNSMNIYVQKSQLGGGSPMIRGFAANRVLISVDGVRMNNAIFRGGNLQNVISVDPLALRSAEVITGPGSVVYGSDAVGGVMNFYFKEAKTATSPEWSGEAYARHASAGSEWTSGAEIAYSGRKWGYLGRFSYSEFGDLKMGSHGPDSYLRKEFVMRQNGEDILVANKDPERQVPSGFNMWSTLHKWKMEPSDYWELGASLYYSTTSEYSRYDRLLRYRNGLPRSAEWNYGPQRWMMANLNATHRFNNPLFNELRVVAAYQHFMESREDRAFGSEDRFTTAEEVDVFSINLDLEKLFSARHRLFYGAEWFFNRVRSSGWVTNIGTLDQMATASRYPDNSRWSSYAFYANYQFRIDRDLNITAGARFNQYHLFGDLRQNNNYYQFPFDEISLTNHAVTGSLGINAAAGELLNWRANVTSAFRAPNMDDAGKIFDSEPGAVVVPNNELSPEYAWSLNAGVAIRPYKAVQLDVDFFYTYLRDAMVRRDYAYNGQSEIEYNGEISRVQAIQNAAFIEVRGLELKLQVPLATHWEWQGALNLAKGEEELDDRSRAPARHVPPMFGNMHLKWEKEQWLVDLFMQYNGEVANRNMAPSELEKDYIYAKDQNGNPYSPSWYTLNLRSQLRVSRAFTLRLGLENITDQRYRTYSSGIAAAGRNLTGALVYRF